MTEQSSDQQISELLENVSKTQAALEEAQAAYNQAKQELESSPLLAEMGLQVIRPTKGKRKGKPWSEERRRKFSISSKKRWSKKKLATN